MNEWLESRRDQIVDMILAGEVTFTEARCLWIAAVLTWAAAQ